MTQRGGDKDQVLSSRRLLRALDEAAAKLEAVQRAKSEPIAVIGMGCRFPGGADDPAAYWQLLHGGMDGITEIPRDRWDVDAYYDPDPEAPEKMYVRHGGFLPRVDGFDARFFEIAPREATSMDPQQRLLLEVTWEALEHAGLAADELTGSATGVFVGLTTNDYSGLLIRHDRSQVDAYFSTGNALNASPGRVAHILGLQGPNMAIDTACSSSLVAVHLACQSLRAGECDLALTGGVNLILSPEVMVAICRARMLAADGRCKTFDAAADGYVRGEGCGVVVLKRLSDALANKDNVLALIRGSAVNQDGASSGFTVPNGRAQEALVRRALANAQIEPAEIDYLEAHGTGTSLGDPIEVRAAASVLGENRSAERPLILGSVKTNIGHLESAAGIAGLIKVVLSLQHGTIPRNLHFQQPNTHIPWEELPVTVATENIAWPQRNRPRLAGLNSFGASGTNAHMILEQALVGEPVPTGGTDRPLHTLALSAKSKDSLRHLAGRYEAYLAANGDINWADVCFSANTGRAHLPIRLTVTAATTAEARKQLGDSHTGQAPRGVIQGAATSGSPPKLAFLFTGQGSQYIGMGRQLYEKQPTFRRELDRCQEILSEHLDRPLLDVLHTSAHAELDHTVYTQPALFALEYALYELWKSWGVLPTAVMGHSVGEYVAACVAGVFSLEDGLGLISQRARLMQQTSDQGAMAAVFADEVLVTSAIAEHAGECSIAALNCPDETVISGSRQAVAAVLAALGARGVRSKELRVSHAFHSPLIEPILADFERIAGAVRYHPPQLTLISNVTGEPATGEIATAQYWVRHMRQSVRFAAGIGALRQRDCVVFLELGPAGTLAGMGRRCVPELETTWLASLKPDGDDWQQILRSLGELYVRGVPVDWRGFDRDRVRRRLHLPTYPWQRQRYWPQIRERGDPAAAVSRRESAMLSALRRGDTAAIMRQLEQVDGFSTEELQVVPKLLDALLAQHQEEQSTDAIRQLVYQIEWRGQSVAGPQLPPDFLLSPQELCRQVRAELGQLVPAQENADYLRVLEQLEEISVDYVIEAWRQMGWVFEVGKRFSIETLAQELAVASRHRPLLERMAEMLSETGILRRAGQQWEVALAVEPLRPGERIAELRKQCPEAVAELTILGRCGTKLADVLRGDQDPLQLLFPEGDVATATSLYRDAPGARLMNRIVKQAAAAAIARLPRNRKLRVLEIGAGTGGTTAAVLTSLPAGQTDYLFTDLSPRFTTAAHETFRAYPFLRYQVLDIERPAASQGIEDQQFDLLIAANVLHATKDLRQTLRHTRRLAAPGAVLLLLEGTAPVRSVDLVFGLTDGWWRFAGDRDRPSHPLISAARWQSLLAECGFADAVPLSLSPEQGGILSKQAVIVAQAAAEEQHKTPPRHWLILADGNGIGRRLGSLHQARGNVCTLVYPGERFEQIGENAFQVAPQRAEDFQRLVAALDTDELEGVVHLWNLDTGNADRLAGAPLDTECQLGCGSTLQLLKSLVDVDLPQLRGMWLVTQGAVAADRADTVPGLAQSALWGMARVICSEHPELKALRVDLDPAAPATDCARMLFEEICSASSEDEVALRKEGRLVPRLVRHYPAAAAELSSVVKFRGDASYLITGGLGGLGLLTARWMVSRGAKSLVLVGRRRGGERAAHQCREMEQLGARLAVYQADVAERDQVARLLSDIEAKLPPLRGVIHAAGVLDDGVLRELSWERFARVMGPKVAGAWNLHVLTSERDLDFFTLYSSFTSILGSAGQANHAAANAQLDALAFYRRARGLPALSINWGAWSGVGAAAEHQVGNRLKLQGGETLTPDQGLELLERLWHVARAQVAVVSVHWDQLPEQLARRPLLAELVHTYSQPTAADEDFLERFQAATPRKRHGLLMDHIRDEVARVLGLEDGAAIEPEQGFFELGMDSLTSIDLRNRLRKSVQCEIPTTVAFDYPTPAELADFLLAEAPTLRDASSVASQPPAARHDQPAEPVNLDELSVEQIETLIDQELETSSRHLSAARLFHS